MIYYMTMPATFKVGDTFNGIEWDCEETLLMNAGTADEIECQVLHVETDEYGKRFTYDYPESAEGMFARLAEKLREQDGRFEWPEDISLADGAIIIRALAYKLEQGEHGGLAS